MKYSDIEETLKRIIDIDNEATSALKKIDELKEERKKELRKIYRDLEFEIMKTVRKEAKLKYKEILKDTNDIVEKLEEEGRIESEHIRKIICDNKEKLAGELYSQIFDGKGSVDYFK